MDTKLFKLLDFCLKKQDIDDENFLFKNYYSLNRWISMSHPEMAKILNLTTNFWLKKSNRLDIFKFYKCILPKYNKNISYFKKNSKIKNNEEEDYKDLAQKYELSVRELKLYNQTLDFLN